MMDPMIIIIISLIMLFIFLLILSVENFVLKLFKPRNDSIERETTMALYTDLLNVIEIAILYYLKTNALYDIARENTELSPKEYEEYWGNALDFIDSMVPKKLKDLIIQKLGEELYVDYILTESNIKLTEIFTIVDIDVLNED